MSGALELSKLAELRAKTDRELAGFINRNLDSALLASETTAESVYADVGRLVRFVEDPGERRRLETKLRHVRERLEGRRSVPAASYAVIGP
jgi:hypothetical protein